MLFKLRALIAALVLVYIWMVVMVVLVWNDGLHMHTQRSFCQLIRPKFSESFSRLCNHLRLTFTRATQFSTIAAITSINFTHSQQRTTKEQPSNEMKNNKDLSSLAHYNRIMFVRACVHLRSCFILLALFVLFINAHTLSLSLHCFESVCIVCIVAANQHKWNRNNLLRNTNFRFLRKFPCYITCNWNWREKEHVKRLCAPALSTW